MDVSALKVALIGPPNAGKTSLLRVLKGEYERLLSVAPTKLVDREMIGLLDKLFVIWDFGGQDLYRQRYVSEPSYFLDEIEYLIYVIDTTDDDKTDLAIQYFEEILQKTKELKYPIKLAIVFNKIDPQAENNPDLHKKANILTEEFESKASNYGLSPKFFRTSIFDSISVIDAFSHFFIDASLKNYTHEIFKEIVKKFTLIYVALFSSSNVVISSASTPFKDPNSLNLLISDIIKSDHFRSVPSNSISIQQKEENVLIIPLKFEKQLFKLLFVSPHNISLETEEIQNIIKELQKNILELLGRMHITAKISF